MKEILHFLLSDLWPLWHSGSYFPYIKPSGSAWHPWQPGMWSSWQQMLCCFGKKKSAALGRNKGLVTSICPLPLYKSPAAAKESAGTNGRDSEQPFRAKTLCFDLKLTLTNWGDAVFELMNRGKGDDPQQRVLISLIFVLMGQICLWCESHRRKRSSMN